MINFISTWVQGIIIAVAIATIIEMILPNGNSKKYIKMVIGIFVIFNIISPIINKFTGKQINLKDIVDIEKYIEEASAYEIDTKRLESTNNSNIKEVYILNLKKDMISKIEEQGYLVDIIKIETEDNEEFTLNNVKLTVHKKQKNKKQEEIQKNNNTQKEIKEVEKINIDVNSDNSITEQSNEKQNILQINPKEINEIKEYINSIYEISKDKIYINE